MWGVQGEVENEGELMEEEGKYDEGEYDVHAKFVK